MYSNHPRPPVASSSQPLFAISSLSLGSNKHHTLPVKIACAAELGYDGIEIFMPDFEAFEAEVCEGQWAELFPTPLSYALPMSSPENSEQSSPFDQPPILAALPPAALASLDLSCALALNQLCTSKGLRIPVLQPLRNFENFGSLGSFLALSNSGHRDQESSVNEWEKSLLKALEEAERWIRLMPKLGTDLLLVCSNFIPGGKTWPFQVSSNPCTSSSEQNDISYRPAPTEEEMETYLDAQVEAFTRLGKLAAMYGVRVGYEPLAWASVVCNWMHVHTIISRVDMPNVGVILDSFNTLGNQYADPSQPNFLRLAPSNIPFSETPTVMDERQARDILSRNFSLLGTTIPGEKIFLYQLADAGGRTKEGRVMIEGKEGTIQDDLSTGEMARMRWSRTSRLFPCEEHLGAWLPVEDMTRAVSATGYRPRCVPHGVWWSLEVFNTSLTDPDPSCVTHHGARGIRGLRKLWDRVCGARGGSVEAELGVAEVKGAPLANSDGFSPSSSESDSSPCTSRSDSTETSVPMSDSSVVDSSQCAKAKKTRNSREVRRWLAAGCVVA